MNQGSAEGQGEMVHGGGGGDCASHLVQQRTASEGEEERENKGGQRWRGESDDQRWITMASALARSKIMVAGLCL